MKELLKLIPILGDLTAIAKLDPDVAKERQEIKTILMKKPKWLNKFYKRMFKVLKNKRKYEKLKKAIEEAEASGQD